MFVLKNPSRLKTKMTYWILIICTAKNLWNVFPSNTPDTCWLSLVLSHLRRWHLEDKLIKAELRQPQQDVQAVLRFVWIKDPIVTVATWGSWEALTGRWPTRETGRNGKAPACTAEIWRHRESLNGDGLQGLFFWGWWWWEVWSGWWRGLTHLALAVPNSCFVTPCL